MVESHGSDAVVFHVRDEKTHLSALLSEAGRVSIVYFLLLRMPLHFGRTLHVVSYELEGFNSWSII